MEESDIVVKPSQVYCIVRSRARTAVYTDDEGHKLGVNCLDTSIEVMLLRVSLARFAARGNPAKIYRGGPCQVARVNPFIDHRRGGDVEASYSFADGTVGSRLLRRFARPVWSSGASQRWQPSEANRRVLGRIPSCWT